MEKTNNKKRYGVLAVVLVALLAAGVGTWAWLSAQQKLDNVFTVGSIDAPEKNPARSILSSRVPTITTLTLACLRPSGLKIPR